MFNDPKNVFALLKMNFQRGEFWLWIWISRQRYWQWWHMANILAWCLKFWKSLILKPLIKQDYTHINIHYCVGYLSNIYCIASITSECLSWIILSRRCHLTSGPSNEPIREQHTAIWPIRDEEGMMRTHLNLSSVMSTIIVSCPELINILFSQNIKTEE